MGHQITKTLDQGWEEMLGGQGALMTSSLVASKLQEAQKNITSSHLTLAVIALPLIALIILL